MAYTNAEKLIVAMLVDLYRPEGKRQLDPELIEEAVLGGHEWALTYKYQGLLLDDEEDSRADVNFVHTVLDMWERIELGYKALDPDAKERVKSALGYEPKYEGWDGNNETKQRAIMRMLVERLDRHPYFRGRVDLNSHFPTLASRRPMVDRYEGIRDEVVNHDLTEAQIIRVLKR